MRLEKYSMPKFSWKPKFKLWQLIIIGVIVFFVSLLDDRVDLIKEQSQHETKIIPAPANVGGR